MKFVEEVAVESFLPTFRSLLAEALRERGLTQSEVAEILGVSQSAVSKYAHGEVERTEAVLEDERVTELVERLADGLATGEMSRVEALAEAEILVRHLERGGVLAALHERAMPELAAHEGFEIHDPESRLRVTERALSSVRRGLAILENASGFAGLIPNVGANLVECVPGAEGIDDVAGVPGRIFDVKGRATVPGDPEFGVSEHVARVLLAARANGTDARAAVNLRYDPALRDRLESLGFSLVEFDGETDPETAIADAAEGEAEFSDADVLYQTGAMGIEPITYLLAPDAETAAERVRDLLRAAE